MNNRQNVKKLLRDFINEVVVAGQFNPGDIRPEGNYRPDGNYRPADAMTYLGMKPPVKEPTPDEMVDDNPEGDEGAEDTAGRPIKPTDIKSPKTPGDAGVVGDEKETDSSNSADATKPAWKNPLI